MTRQAVILKANGAEEIFDRRKLLNSLAKAGANLQLAEKITRHIEGEIQNGMTTHDIFKHAFYLLHRAERPTALRYSLRRSLMDLGPSGFPFEKFIGEIFRQKGYEVLTDQLVKGRCVEHEIDVIAYNETELIMMEVKFHNQLGIKSDLKVALYVKARFDDLREVSFNYGGKNRKITDSWLITNTKFTITAIEYAECQRLKLIGWNHPTDESLVSMIEQSGLHPVTSLTTLKVEEKQQLMKKGVVLCSTVRDNPDRLRELGMKNNEVEAVLGEANLLCPIDDLSKL